MNSIYYGDVLDSNEILNIGLLLSDYKDRKITYLEFKDKMKEIGFDLDVKFIDTKRMKLLRHYNEFNERVSTNTIVDTDVDRYLAVGENGIQFYFWYDRNMIEVLAENNNQRAMEILDSLRRYEQRLSGGRTVNYERRK